MFGWTGHCLRSLFRIPGGATTIAARGFRPCEPRIQQRLEQIGAAFTLGYHAGLEDPTPAPIARAAATLKPELRGFAFEGAGMALMLLDVLLPFGGRFERLLAGPGRSHAYMVHVGAGWAWARCGVSVRRRLRRLDPLLGWLAVDGFGFHEGYFRHPRSIERRFAPRQLTGYARCVFDQGLGRSLWFVRSCDVGEIVKTILRFDSLRRPDLWSGVGLASAYAGCCSVSGLAELAAAAGRNATHMAQGAAFAAKTRLLARNLCDETEIACRVLCGTSAIDAARVTDDALKGLDHAADLPVYEQWRSRIRAHYVSFVADEAGSCVA